MKFSSLFGVIKTSWLSFKKSNKTDESSGQIQAHAQADAPGLVITSTKNASLKNNALLESITKWCLKFYESLSSINKCVIWLSVFLGPVYLFMGVWDLLKMLTSIINRSPVNTGLFISLIAITLLLLYTTYLIINYQFPSTAKTAVKRAPYIGVHPCIKFSYVPAHLLNQPAPVPHTSVYPTMRSAYEDDDELEKTSQTSKNAATSVLDALDFLSNQVKGTVYENEAEEGTEETDSEDIEEEEEDYTSLYDEIKDNLGLDDNSDSMNTINENLN